MNIFYLDSDPKKAAQSHNDRHVVKMILESAQLLSTAHRMLDGKEVRVLSKNGRKIKHWKLFDEREDILYKATHHNHPCAVWARNSADNYLWLYNLFLWLCFEYKYRYGKDHLCWTKLRVALSNVPNNIARLGFTEPAQAMPHTYRAANPVKAYKNYYLHEKKHLAKWTKRPRPKWYTAVEK